MKGLPQEQKDIIASAKRLSQQEFITKYSSSISKSRLSGEKYEEVEIQLLNEKLTIVWHLRKGCYTYYGFLVIPTSDYKLVEGKIVFL
jgi:hypothetical protein